jgi:AcrR family transcriptional regulator
VTTDGPVKLSRRERTRGNLVRAGRDLITEKGVAGLRISEITEGAGVALGSFYNHFGSKEELVEAVVADSLGALAETVATKTTADQDPAELVSIAIRRFIGIAYEDPDSAQLVVRLEHADALLVESVHPPARRAVDEGIASGRFSVPDTATAVTGIIGGALTIMRAIADGRVGPGAQSAYAELALRALGLPAAEAAEIVARPLPADATAPAA